MDIEKRKELSEILNSKVKLMGGKTYVSKSGTWLIDSKGNAITIEDILVQWIENYTRVIVCSPEQSGQDNSKINMDIEKEKRNRLDLIYFIAQLDEKYTAKEIDWREYSQSIANYVEEYYVAKSKLEEVEKENKLLREVITQYLISIREYGLDLKGFCQGSFFSENLKKLGMEQDFKRSDNTKMVEEIIGEEPERGSFKDGEALMND